MARTFKNFIAGSWVAPSTGEYYENRNPADWRDLIGRFPSSGKRDVERAIASAWRGFEQWKRVPVPQRGDVLRRVGDLVFENAREGTDTIYARSNYSLGMGQSIEVLRAQGVVDLEDDPAADVAQDLLLATGVEGFQVLYGTDTCVASGPSLEKSVWPGKKQP